MLVLAILILGSAAATSDEIIVADEVRVAFYEKAPPIVAASMKKAVAELCRRDPTRSPTRKGHGWICYGSALNFLRAVELTGNKLSIGFVCDDKTYPQTLRYYLSEMLDDNPSCAGISYDFERMRHYFASDE